MVARYRKGYMNELRLVHLLSKMGYMVVRTPRSGRINLASPDIIALKNGKVIVVECKAREEAFRVDEAQLNELRQWENAGARAYVAWKLSRKDWVFLRLGDVMNNTGRVGKAFSNANGIKIDQIDS